MWCRACGVASGWISTRAPVASSESQGGVSGGARVASRPERAAAAGSLMLPRARSERRSHAPSTRAMACSAGDGGGARARRSMWVGRRAASSHLKALRRKLRDEFGVIREHTVMLKVVGRSCSRHRSSAIEPPYRTAARWCHAQGPAGSSAHVIDRAFDGVPTDGGLFTTAIDERSMRTETPKTTWAGRCVRAHKRSVHLSMHYSDGCAFDMVDRGRESRERPCTST